MRDPRINPERWDIVRSSGETRTVTGIFPNGLSRSSDAYSSVCMFRTWRKWAKGGEIVRAFIATEVRG